MRPGTVAGMPTDRQTDRQAGHAGPSELIPSKLSPAGDASTTEAGGRCAVLRFSRWIG